MNRKINKKMSVTEQIKIIHDMMENMNAVDREVMSDRLIAYLLFEKKSGIKNYSDKAELKLSNSNLSPEELMLIKELAKRTEDLKNLLGEDPHLFR